MSKIILVLIAGTKPPSNSYKRTLTAGFSIQERRFSMQALYGRLLKALPGVEMSVLGVRFKECEGIDGTISHEV